MELVGYLGTGEKGTLRGGGAGWVRLGVLFGNGSGYVSVVSACKASA